MSIFRKKKNNGYVQIEQPRSELLIDSFNESVDVMGYSSKFVEDSRDPEAVEKARLKGKSYDWLLSEKRDAVFEEDARAEINFLKSQLTNCQRLILPLAAKQKGELSAAYAERDLIKKEIEFYDNAEKKLLGEESENV